MLDYRAEGLLPAKHHIVHREDGNLLVEECITRRAFDGPYSIVYHRYRPQAQTEVAGVQGFALPQDGDAEMPLRKRHFTSQTTTLRKSGPALHVRTPLFYNTDIVVSVLYPTEPDPSYFVNGDGDDLFYIHEGGGILRSVFGDLRFTTGDYVCVPKGVVHRFIPDAGVPQHWVVTECFGGVRLLDKYRNETGQLRMDAPYSHRDFTRPTFRGVIDEGIRDVVVKRAGVGGGFHGFRTEHTPLDVVGYDGTVYPWVFPILKFQPRTGQVHLPPDSHGTFVTRGAIICSFVPRVVDFHPEAIPCPYPHSSVDCDEILFYCKGNFTSRKGVGPGSLSFHPMGIPHGPHPGAYEASIGTKETTELAVMIDTFVPLRATVHARNIEDADYMKSFL